jgi:drug/metabolite transporter (DMT)-like permease
MLAILAFLDVMAALFMAIPSVCAFDLDCDIDWHVLWIIGGVGSTSQFLSGIWTCCIAYHMNFLLKTRIGDNNAMERALERFYIAIVFVAFCILCPCLVFFGITHQQRKYDSLVCAFVFGMFIVFAAYDWLKFVNIYHYSRSC